MRYLRRIDEETRISRRDSLLKLGGLLAGAAAVGGWKVADSLGAEDVAGSAVACVLAPESTEGPFYLDDHKVRRNITEGKPGVPLTLRLAVVDASTCRAIGGATVDIWHCDAGGVGGFKGSSQHLVMEVVGDGCWEASAGGSRDAWSDVVAGPALDCAA